MRQEHCHQDYAGNCEHCREHSGSNVFLRTQHVKKYPASQKHAQHQRTEDQHNQGKVMKHVRVTYQCVLSSTCALKDTQILDTWQITSGCAWGGESAGYAMRGDGRSSIWRPIPASPGPTSPGWKTGGRKSAWARWRKSPLHSI